MKLEEVMNNAEIEKKISEVEDFDGLVKLLREYGVEFDEEELKAALSQNPADGELDESALENVAGGGKAKDVWDWFRKKIKEAIRKNPVLRPGHGFGNLIK